MGRPSRANNITKVGSDISIFVWGDSSRGFTFCGGNTVPSAIAGFAPGCIFLHLDGAAGDKFLINQGSANSCAFEAVDLNGLDLSGLTATASELNRLDDDNSTWSVQAGTGVTGGTGTIYKSTDIKIGDVIRSTLLIDLTGLASIATDGDVIGVGATAAHFGRIVAAEHGTILGGIMTCLETPAGGEVDIDIYTSTAATGVLDDAAGSLAGASKVLDAAGDWAAATVKTIGATVPAANSYLYLSVGTASSPTAGTYTAGKFVLELFGYA